MGTFKESEYFVFGSNEKGAHGAGAARYAVVNCGAIYGQGIGLQGHSYAIPTKDRNINTLPLDAILDHVKVFLCVADTHPEKTFRVTAIGCGLAGYTPEDIAPMFADAPTNCILPERFKPWIKTPGISYWES
jgi:hypothetical protein